MQLRTLDLFHGAGGSSIGAKLAGAQIIAGLDFWPVASQVYSKNLTGVTAFNADIRNVSPRAFHRTIGDIDLIVASPECTNHTCAKGSRPRCEESKLTAFQVTRFAAEFRPKWIIIENVVQMQSWSGHPALLEELWKLGYFVREEKLNAQDFGVPQSRRRLFLLCSLTGETENIKFPKRKIRPASSIIDTNGDYQFTPLFIPTRAQDTIARAERAMAQLGNSASFLIVYYGTDGSGGWQPLDRPLRTVTTIDRFAFVKPTKNGHVMRMLQPEELRKAMGFPKTYKLNFGTRRDKIRLLGNAVCPPTMCAIVKNLTGRLSDGE